jgi:hypothetical protein
VVLPGTYVGDGVRLDSAVVDQDRILVLTEEGPMLVAAAVAVASLSDHLPGRLIATAGRWQRRTSVWLSRLYEAGRNARKSVSERLGGTNRAGGQPDAMPAVTD